MKISAIILFKNEEALLKDCLDSVSWVNEIVIIDNGEEDKASRIAKDYNAKVIKSPRGNFSDRRNLGAENSTSDWLFYIDVDERVTPALKKEIKDSVKNGSYLAYAIPRSNILLGRKMHWGGWLPDYVLRLIKKDALVKWSGALHEQPVVKGDVGKLKNPLIHISHRSLTEMVEKTNDWSLVEARLLFESKHPKMTWWRFISVALREFWYRGILKLGFLDGTVGVIEIIYQMFSRMITYAKLWEMQIKNESRNI
jgi:glycosyltransferase involved in cell wall biosynthesis